MAQLQPYCAIEGNDDGLPVVFVHGMGVDHRSLMMLDKAFDGNDSIRRIYLDLPGFGRTPPCRAACGCGNGGLAQTALDGLVGKAAPFAMVGNSMGGALVREVLAREPRRVAGMVLIAPVVDPAACRPACGRTCGCTAQSQADALLAAGTGVRFHYHGRQPVIRRVATLPTVHPARRGVVRPCGMRTTGSALLAGR